MLQNEILVVLKLHNVKFLLKPIKVAFWETKQMNIVWPFIDKFIFIFLLLLLLSYLPSIGIFIFSFDILQHLGLFKTGLPRVNRVFIILPQVTHVFFGCFMALKFVFLYFLPEFSQAEHMVSFLIICKYF